MNGRELLAKAIADAFEADEAKATERNQSGYYDRYNRRGLPGES